MAVVEDEELRPSDGDLDQVLEALANPHRREIVYLLGLQPWAISQLARERGLSLPAMHKHVKLLENVGLVRRHKRGRITYLTLDPRPLALLQAWVGQFHPFWGSDQASYQNYARHLGFDATAELAATPSPTGAPE